MSRGVLGWALCAMVLAGPACATDTVYYYYTDALHSAVAVTDAQGNVIERTTYAPYGQVLNRDLRDGPGYGGHAEDPETQLVYMQQRYYDAQSGRFLSVDPVAATEDGGNFNRYAYASDNPYTYTDPNGMADEPSGQSSGQDQSDRKQHVTQFKCTGSLVTCPGGTKFYGQSRAQAEAIASHQSHCGAACSSAHVNRAYQAVDKYKIKGEGYAIKYDNGQHADGLTSPNGIVTLGPSAYKSESWLGSTLGHEIEVHWDRQFQLLGPYKSAAGFYFREVEAYKYNVQNFNRFGNTKEEQIEYYNRLKFNEHGYEFYKDKNVL